MWYGKGLAGGNNSVVECDLAKVEVAGSNPVSRSNFSSCASIAAVVAVVAAARSRAASRAVAAVPAADGAAHTHRFRIQIFSRVASSHARGAVAKW